MLIQIEYDDTKVNVYIEARGFIIFNKLSREDLYFVRRKVTECITSLLNKYKFMYSERGKKDVVA